MLVPLVGLLLLGAGVAKLGKDSAESETTTQKSDAQGEKKPDASAKKKPKTGENHSEELTKLRTENARLSGVLEGAGLKSVKE